MDDRHAHTFVAIKAFDAMAQDRLSTVIGNILVYVEAIHPDDRERVGGFNYRVVAWECDEDGYKAHRTGCTDSLYTRSASHAALTFSTWTDFAWDCCGGDITRWDDESDTRGPYLIS